MIEWIEIDRLTPNPKNPNKHSKEQIDRLSEIIKYQGWRHPIIVDKNYMIWAGHGRLSAAKKLKLEKVPIHIQEFQSEDQAYAFLVSDNAIASWAELDLGAINLQIPEFTPDFDIDLLGIKDFVLEPADKYGDKDADAIPEKVEAITKPGDLWILGEHRLLCWDSTKREDVDRLMAGEKADMVFTDPPYGVSYEQGKYNGNVPDKKFEPIANDELRGEDLKEFLKKVWGFAPFKEGCVVYCFAPALIPSMQVLLSLIESGIHIQSQIIWKKQLVPGRADYQWSHENCWYGYVGKGHYWYGGRTDTTVWEQNRDHKYVHPTQKPVELAERACRNSTVANNVLYEPFAGSGSTLIACEKTGRKCYGMEIDPHYCDVIIKRFEDFSGTKARLA